MAYLCGMPTITLGWWPQPLGPSSCNVGLDTDHVSSAQWRYLANILLFDVELFILSVIGIHSLGCIHWDSLIGMHSFIYWNEFPLLGFIHLFIRFHLFIGMHPFIHWNSFIHSLWFIYSLEFLFSTSSGIQSLIHWTSFIHGDSFIHSPVINCDSFIHAFWFIH